MAKWEVVCDDVLRWAEGYSSPPFHAILTDPPYSLGNGERGFMNKAWDNGIAFRPETWAALAEHLLPGAHILAFGGDRTHHRLMCAIEDAGLEIRTCLYWAFGSGFPKSLNVGKAIDKAAGAEREVVGKRQFADGTYQRATARAGIYSEQKGQAVITAPATPAAATWEGYGSALKPAVEVIVMARKPLDGTIAANCERYGSGALNIDGTRIGTGENLSGGSVTSDRKNPMAGDGRNGKALGMFAPGSKRQEGWQSPAGRWPANLILDDSEAVAGLFPTALSAGFYKNPTGDCVKRDGSGSVVYPSFDNGNKDGRRKTAKYSGQNGSAVRFFFAADWSLDQAEQLDAADVLRYAAKASRAERDAGLDNLPARDVPYTDYRENAKGTKSWVTEYPDGTPRPMSKLRNAHPTVKPLSLCRYLATLLLPPAAYAPRRILVPFAGVGSEMIGAGLAGWDEIVGIEQELEYTQIAEARLAYWLRQPELALR